MCHFVKVFKKNITGSGKQTRDILMLPGCLALIYHILPREEEKRGKITKSYVGIDKKKL